MGGMGITSGLPQAGRIPSRGRIMKKQARASQTLAAAACALLLIAAACGGTGAEQAASLEPALRSADGRFALALLDGSMISDQRALRMEVSEQGGKTLVQLSLADGSGLKALYYELYYDPDSLTPVALETTGVLGGGELIGLALSSERGVLSAGHVLPNFDQRGPLHAGGELASFSFTHVAQGEVRSASNVPASDAAIAPAQAVAGSFGTSELLLFQVAYTNPGDYDQNGLVAISDLTPLGQHFNEAVPAVETPSPFGVENLPLESMIDGDGNGLINIADVTPIGANFGNDVLGGYNVYASADASDKPSGNTDPSTIAPLGSFELGTVTESGNPALDRLHYRYGQPSVPPSQLFLWARPVDAAGNEGTPSQTARIAGGGALTLSLSPPPLAGSGDSSAPYELDVLTDYQISLTHSVDGDVTTDPDTALYLFRLGDILTEPDPEVIEELHEVSSVFPGVGSIDDVTGELDLLDAYEGAFVLYGIYAGRLATPLYCVAPDPDNNAPIAIIEADATSGIAPWTASLSASQSIDTDGDIVVYEWDIGNDGSFEHTGASPLLIHEINAGGTLAIGLRITDDDGAVATSSINLNTAGWLSTVLDEVSDTAPAEPMLESIDGQPAVAYRQFNTLKYVRASNALGSAWNDSVAVPLSVTAQHICLREVSGRPAMAYKRSGSEPGIYYVLGNAADAATFEQVRITEGALDHSPTLNVIDGNPALAYAWHTADEEDYTLLYVRASDSLGNTGGAWDLISAGLVMDANEFYIDKTALTIADSQLPATDGRPALIFIANDDEFGLSWNLYFTKATNTPATTWSLPADLGDNGTTPISYAAVASIVSRPHLVYFHDDGLLAVRRATDLAATDWAPQLDLAASAEVGHHASAANVGGFMHVAYYNAAKQAVEIRGTDSPTFEDAFALDDIVAESVGEYDPTGHVSRYLSMGAAQGEPVVAYHDLSDATLKFARYIELP
jgi:hypothetical protein